MHETQLLYLRENVVDFFTVNVIVFGYIKFPEFYIFRVKILEKKYPQNILDLTFLQHNITQKLVLPNLCNKILS